MINTKAFKRQRNIYGWLFSMPAIISLLLFVVYPVVFSIFLSFTNMRSVLNNVKFVGLDNYQWLFSQRGVEYWKGVLYSLEFSLLSTILQTVVGFLFAYVLYSMSKKFQTIYKTLFYLPVILPGALVAIMWKFIFAHDVGMIDNLLSLIGIKNPPAWLVTPGYAMGSVIVANTWRFVGISLILYFVSMNSISKDVLEAAKIDGAGKFRILLNFIFPLTFSMTKVNLIMSFVGGIKSFDMFFLMTQGQGNTTVVGMIIYNMAFKSNIMSLAVSMSLILTLMLSIIIYFGNFYLGRMDRRNE